MLKNFFFAGDSNVVKMIKLIMEKSFSPAIVFSFSRKECEVYALEASRLDFNSRTLIFLFLF